MKMSFPYNVILCFFIFACCEFLNNAHAQIPGLGTRDSTRRATSSELNLVTISPKAQATNVCIDTPLRLTFNAPPMLSKSGTIQILDDTGAVVDSIDISARFFTKTIGGLTNFNYYPIIINGNEAYIAFKNNIFAYGKTYEVKISKGSFVDKEGNAANLEAAKKWRFTTKSSAPELPDLESRTVTVSADNSADFATVQGALDFIPADNTAPTRVFIKNGTYYEIVYFSDKHNLTIIGQDRKQTIIQYSNNQNLNNTDRTMMPGGYRRGMLRAVNCNDLTVTHLTLRNPTPSGGGQSEAIILNGGADAHAIITGVDLYGHQDTLQINGQAYISNCYIEGDVDFMWGKGPCFFENCHLTALRNKSMYTQIRNPATNHGYIYKNCTFDGASGITECLLSRVSQARFPYSEVVLIDCILTGAVSPVGWRLESPGEAPNIHFWEYNSRNSESDPIDDSKRFAVSKRLTMESNAETIANYSNPAWVLGNNWNPKNEKIFTQ